MPIKTYVQQILDVIPDNNGGLDLKKLIDGAVGAIAKKQHAPLTADEKREFAQFSDMATSAMPKILASQFHMSSQQATQISADNKISEAEALFTIAKGMSDFSSASFKSPAVAKIFTPSKTETEAMERIADKHAGEVAKLGMDRATLVKSLAIFEHIFHDEMVKHPLDRLAVKPGDPNPSGTLGAALANMTLPETIKSDGKLPYPPFTPK